MNASLASVRHISAALLSPQELAQALEQRRCRAAVFDFDGTLSRLRSGWPHLMAQLWYEYWQAAGLSTSAPAEVQQQLLHLVLTTNGMPPLRQMQVFTQWLAAAGGAPVPDPQECATVYQQRLMNIVQQRYALLQQRVCPPQQWQVPGAAQILATLQQRGWQLFLLTGTEYQQVGHEIELLDLAQFFPQRLFAPHGPDPTFSKGRIIQQILQDYKLDGRKVIGFGDGVVETREIKRIGGLAIGLATAEHHGVSAITDSLSDPLQNATTQDKYLRLLLAGADLIVSDFYSLLPVFTGG
jgi:phosphoglycolate phosphatase-like HAD superfamily hydrolase